MAKKRSNGPGFIFVKNAREHNLKGIDVRIPRNKFVVITGVSGSGKSSLAFDTIYAEGQRRYVESLSAYARQFLGLMEKPDVEYIEGLSPAISIEQKSASKNPRSTVGTVTEIYDYLRLLYARIGIAHCPKCGKIVKKQSSEQIINRVLRECEGQKVRILSSVIRGKKGEHCKVMEGALRNGFVWARVNGRMVDLRKTIPSLARYKMHDIELVIDKLTVSRDKRKRLADSVETALGLGEGSVIIHQQENEEDLLLSEQFACKECGIDLPEFTPRLFSFNSPYGACKECHGLGTKIEIDPDLVIPDTSKSLIDGAIVPWPSRHDSYYMGLLKGLARHFHFSMRTPVSKLRKNHLEYILYGTPTGVNDIKFSHVSEDGTGLWEYEGGFEGVIPNLERLYRDTDSDARRERISRFMREAPCPACGGRRLCPEALAVTISGINVSQLTSRTVEDSLKFFQELKLSARERKIAKQVLKEISARLGFLQDVGLGYLTLDRAALTLSGGEAQRIRLATQIGSGLVGVLYILDEPSIGLHQKDNLKLLETLTRLRNLGNTLIVVEHDEQTIRAADYVIDMGPGAGIWGGHIVASGTPRTIINCEKSITGAYLRGEKSIPVPKNRRRPKEGARIVIEGACENNLKDLTVSFPAGLFTCVTGVSGSGKSSLVTDTLNPALALMTRHGIMSTMRVGAHTKLSGHKFIDQVITIDQSPIGRTPRSNPATYTGIFTPIRELFATTPEARLRGYRPGRFSFNVRGGRCEACEGAGTVKIEMHFLPDVYVSCDVCHGKRYNRETLEVRYKGKNISDVLEMTVDETLEFFQNIPKIRRRLQTLSDVGLGYIKLGQSATTLSGGEAQRIKLAKELGKTQTGRTFYTLDEPTTGLHFDDIKKLLSVLSRLVDRGNTVVVIEHNLDVVKTADHIIDLGPDGGDAGGRIVAEGTPEQVAECEKSYTGQFLKPLLLKAKSQTRKKTSKR